MRVQVYQCGCRGVKWPELQIIPRPRKRYKPPLMQLATTYITCLAINGNEVTIGPANPQQGMQIEQTTITIPQLLLRKFTVGETTEIKVLAPEI